MSLSKENKMGLLLEQINLEKDIVSDYFTESKIKKLEVFTKSKRWHFHIETVNILPAIVYKNFLHKIKKSFEQIAKVDVTLYPMNEEVDEKFILDYWNVFLQTTNNLPPGLNGSITNQRPQINNNQIIVIVQNEPQSISLKRHLTEDFKHFCQRAGLPNILIETKIETNNNDIEKFRQQQADEDKQIVKKLAKAEQNRKQNSEKKQEVFMFGYKINDEPIAIENILEEEHRKTIQGYVFDSETIKLRSGRSLLVLKVTDYTDSLEIKVFSRNDDDETVFKQAKKGDRKS